MNKIYFIFLAMIFTNHMANAQTFEVVPIHESGDRNEYINYVFLGDGYRESELDKYLEDVRKVTELFLEESPFVEYKNYLNFYAIKVPSNVSGASRDPNALIDNYFGSSYNAYGIERLLVPYRSSKVYAVLADNIPQYDQAIIIVNDDKYGGSGGALATFSTNASAAEIAIHEVGHSFAKLADEYWAGAVYATEKPNMTKNNNAETVKWKNWLNDSFGVGIYAHSGDPSWYKPHQNCKMEYLGRDFCAVCKETFVERFHQLRGPLLSYMPSNIEVLELASDESLSFRLNIIANQPNTIKTEWRLNGELIDKNMSEIIVNANNLIEGESKLTVTIADTTALSRSGSHLADHSQTLTWTLMKQATVSFSVEVMDLTCYGESDGVAILSSETALDAYEFSIDGLNFQASPVFDGLSKGTYEVSVREKNGEVLETIPFELKEPAEIDVNLELTHFTENSSGSVHMEITGGAGVKLTRLDSNGSFEDENLYQNLTAGTYLLEVKDENECLKTLSFEIEDQSQILGVEEENTPKVYPTVFDSKVNLENSDQLESVRLMSQNGILLQEWETVELRSVLEVGNIEAGLYLIQLREKSGKVRTQKVVKKGN
ncbi:M64 family metallopeptidase [Aureibacter tunicatorum]|uniref:Secreted protein (Por secretion system target) n=1 Tax=Aureibacter tunicatorum TaxID=866807 RepID=A0AAE4BPQ5_9BACT|nr:M64 family metallopeptidase [Aureibacter tunicatorum]MDR6238239.1 hypothetical protein [Aureibacter tunicatorum]BDD03272.1 hypothetical protein AUTU_07550 [Aureibacter tunicatorum]